MHHNEECWILLGTRWNSGKWFARRTKYSIGEPSSVAFNPNWVIEREQRRGDILGFIHTHPQTVAQPSSTDYTTMQAWTFALGRPLLCCIQGTDGLRAHWFFDDESSHVEGVIHQLGWLYWGTVPEKPLVVSELEFNDESNDHWNEHSNEEMFVEFNKIQKGIIHVD